MEWDKQQRENPTDEERPITLKNMACDTTAIKWMLENHFDIFGLIEKDLAINANGKNLY